MSRKSKTPNKPPSYRLHKPSGRAVVTLYGRDHYLGIHGSKESHEAYRRLVAEWMAPAGHASLQRDSQTQGDVDVGLPDVFLQVRAQPRVTRFQTGVEQQVEKIPRLVVPVPRQGRQELQSALSGREGILEGIEHFQGVSIPQTLSDVPAGWLHPEWSRPLLPHSTTR